MYMKSKSAKVTEDEATDKEEDKEKEHGMPTLVMIDDKSDMAFSSVVPKKGVMPYAVMRIANDISLLGHPKVILKSDNEPAILALKEAVKA